MNKKWTAFTLSALLLLSGLSIKPTPVSATSMNDAEVFLKQETPVTCTLVSSTMALRRKAILLEDNSWTNMTEESVKTSGWHGGLSRHFNYSSDHYQYEIDHQFFSDEDNKNIENKKKAILDLLKKHPEGIALYARSGYNGFKSSSNHCILLTDYREGIFYCADPAGTSNEGEIPISQARKVTIENAASYWYIKNITAKDGTPLYIDDKINFKTVNVHLSQSSFTYNGRTQKPSVSLSCRSHQLEEGKDYQIEMPRESINAHTYTIKLTGINNYTGSLTCTYTINPLNINQLNTKVSRLDFDYDGKFKTASVIMRDKDKILMIGNQYTIDYPECKDVGQYTISIQGVNNYTGRIKKTLTIKGKDLTTLQVKASNNQVKVSYKKIKGTQYEIAYRLKNKNWQTLTTSQTYYTFNNLKNGQYEFKVRIHNNGYHGQYSSTKLVTIKKKSYRQRR